MLVLSVHLVVKGTWELYTLSWYLPSEILTCTHLKKKYHDAQVLDWLTCWYSMLQGKITYVVRPLLPSSCVSKSGLCGNIGTKDPLNLGGYGVELALKNMEYKAMDDSAVKKGQFFF